MLSLDNYCKNCIKLLKRVCSLDLPGPWARNCFHFRVVLVPACPRIEEALLLHENDACATRQIHQSKGSPISLTSRLRLIYIFFYIWIHVRK